MPYVNSLTSSKKNWFKSFLICSEYVVINYNCKFENLQKFSGSGFVTREIKRKKYIFVLWLQEWPKINHCTYPS